VGRGGQGKTVEKMMNFNKTTDQIFTKFPGMVNKYYQQKNSS